ncbi:PEP-CTERM sorting domain-containing protein [Thiobacillus sp.]
MSVQAYSSPRSLTGWAFAAFLALVTSTASAAVLYQQPPLDGGLGYYANPNFPQQMADDFTLGGAVSLEGITWWGGYDGNLDDAGDDDFLVRLYSDVSGTGTVLEEFGTVTFSRTVTSLHSPSLLDVAGNDVYQYDFALTAPLGLSSGTYYLFVQNLSSSSDWFWLQGSSGNGDLWYRSEDPEDPEDPVDPKNWNAGQGEGDLALRLEGTQVVQVPEPSSLALLGIAGLSMLLAGRRRQRQAV